MPMKMPSVMDCSVTDCAYNKGKACHAMAVTIGHQPNQPHCDTYFRSDTHGGVKDMTAGVGACKTSSCHHNRDFECTASTIQVGMKGSQPDCLTYEGE